MTKDPNFRLQWTSKMPGPAWSIPAANCITGAKLRAADNTVCSKCYALKNRYLFKNVQKPMQANLDAWKLLGSTQWVELAISQIEMFVWFRWFASGDLQSVGMLEDIEEVAKHTPRTQHWLPTRETQFVDKWLEGRSWFDVPENLAVRVSLTRINPVTDKRNRTYRQYPCTSSVHSDDSFTCPSSLQHGECGKCRECWDITGHVKYKLH